MTDPGPPNRHLVLHRPGRVVVVRTEAGTARALLLAQRSERVLCQVHRGTGDEVLRWMPASAVLGPAGSG